MDDETTASLYLQMKDLAKRFVGKYEIGIAVEIRAFLEGKEDIQEFYESLDEDGYYFIDIYLKHLPNMGKGKPGAWAISILPAEAPLSTSTKCLACPRTGVWSRMGR